MQPIPAGHNAFTYTYRGSIQVAGTTVSNRHMALLANDAADGVCIEAQEDSRLLIIAGQPLNEPIVQHGPFVMNTAEEIQQTMRDYHAGKFEAAVVRSL